MIWRIKKYDWSREVTWRENKSSCFPPDVVFPYRVSRHIALRCITSCFNFRYNKQIIAQLVGGHEDLSHPENSCLPRARPRATWIFWVGQICMSPSKLGNKCIMYHATIMQLYMWRHLDVQADWRRRWIYGRDPNAIDQSYKGSLTYPYKHRYGVNLFTVIRETAPFQSPLTTRTGILSPFIIRRTCLHRSPSWMIFYIILQ